MRTHPWIQTIVSTLLVLGLASLSSAATPPPAASQAMIQALTKANTAVVAVLVTAADGARSVETLGKQCRGSGVVIGPDGLILTIDYLMVEAQTIEVVTQDNRTVPALAVAHHIATGFGLIRSLLPLRGIAPVSLGSHRDAPLFNQRGELLGIGSLFMGDVMGQNQCMPGNMFVPVDLL